MEPETQTNETTTTSATPAEEIDPDLLEFNQSIESLNEAFPDSIQENMEITQAVDEEPLFDQFDELEDVLSELAGELGVHEI